MDVNSNGLVCKIDRGGISVPPSDRPNGAASYQSGKLALFRAHVPCGMVAHALYDADRVSAERLGLAAPCVELTILLPKSR